MAHEVIIELVFIRTILIRGNCSPFCHYVPFKLSASVCMLCHPFSRPLLVLTVLSYAHIRSAAVDVINDVKLSISFFTPIVSE